MNKSGGILQGNETKEKSPPDSQLKTKLKGFSCFSGIGLWVECKRKSTQKRMPEQKKARQGMVGGWKKRVKFCSQINKNK
jgi:hypothetical protein